MRPFRLDHDIRQGLPPAQFLGSASYRAGGGHTVGCRTSGSGADRIATGAAKRGGDIGGNRPISPRLWPAIGLGIAGALIGGATIGATQQPYGYYGYPGYYGPTITVRPMASHRPMPAVEPNSGAEVPYRRKDGSEFWSAVLSARFEPLSRPKAWHPSCCSNGCSQTSSRDSRQQLLLDFMDGHFHEILGDFAMNRLSNRIRKIRSDHAQRAR